MWPGKGRINVTKALKQNEENRVFARADRRAAAGLSDQGLRGIYAPQTSGLRGSDRPAGAGRQNSDPGAPVSKKMPSKGYSAASA